MKKYDVYLIGHITYDKLRDDVDMRETHFYGGAQLFSAYAAQAAGGRVGLLTRMSGQHMPILELLPFSEEDICCLESPETTSMLNWYTTRDREIRQLIVTGVATPFSMADVPEDVESKIYYLAGLLLGDYAPDMAERLSLRGKVAVDLQGFLRRRDEADGKVYFADYPPKKELLPHVTFLKADAAEAEIITGVRDREKAARLLCQWGAKEVMITHNSQVIVCRDGRIWRASLSSQSLAGRTGRGDTIFGAYTARRLRHSIPRALAFAAAAVSLKLEQPGPLKKSTKEILEYQNKMN